MAAPVKADPPTYFTEKELSWAQFGAPYCFDSSYFLQKLIFMKARLSLPQNKQNLTDPWVQSFMSHISLSNPTPDQKKAAQERLIMFFPELKDPKLGGCVIDAVRELLELEVKPKVRPSYPPIPSPAPISSTQTAVEHTWTAELETRTKGSGS